MTPDRKRWLLRGVKFALALVVLFFVGVKFQRDLAGLDVSSIELRPGWLLLSAGLYLIALFPSAWLWRHLLERFGYPLSLSAASRAHYAGQLGKYVPGKAMAILIRVHLAHPFGVPYGVAVIASFYEVFTGMAAGALVAAGVFMIEPPGELNLGWHPAWVGVALIGACGVPLLPAVFNFVIARLSAWSDAVQLYRLPPVRMGTLSAGLLVTTAGWGLQGLSVWALLQGVLPEAPELLFAWWIRCTAAIAFANVAGFAVFFLPAGVGVREVLLTVLLSTAGPAEFVAAAVILLRLVWIVAEALIALCMYLVKPRDERSDSRGLNPL